MFRRIKMYVCAIAPLVVLTSGQVAAQDKPDNSACTLFRPTPKDKMRDFNTDRPTKSNVPWTVPCGHFQYEGDLFIYTYDPSSTFDTTNIDWILFNPTFKLGLLNNVDFEVNFSAYNTQQSFTRSTGAVSGVAGFGDTFTRLKVNLFGNDGGPAAMALIPYGKWPTAPVGVGNGYVEFGAIAPLAVSLPLGFTTILMGEFDYKKNPHDNGFHGEFPALLNLNRQIVEGLTGYVEIYADWSSNHDVRDLYTLDFALAWSPLSNFQLDAGNHDVRDLYTLDFALAWSPLSNFQLDAGINIGLVPAAPAYQIYMGISQRF
jgi:hypothetical protein